MKQYFGAYKKFDHEPSEAEILQARKEIANELRKHILRSCTPILKKATDKIVDDPLDDRTLGFWSVGLRIEFETDSPDRKEYEFTIDGTEMSVKKW